MSQTIIGIIDSHAGAKAKRTIRHGCSLEPEFVQLKFEGRVTDATTGAAIAGATVSLVEAFDVTGGTPLASGTSDANGHYTLSYADCADVPFITGEANGYQFVGVAIGCREGTQTLHLALTPVS